MASKCQDKSSIPSLDRQRCDDVLQISRKTSEKVGYNKISKIADILVSTDTISIYQIHDIWNVDYDTMLITYLPISSS